MAGRIAVCSWSMRPAGPDELRAALDRVGVRAVQLALGPLVREPAVWSDATARLRRAGIDVVSGMMAFAGEDYSTLESIARTGGVRPDASWPANRAHAEAVARRATMDGIGIVTFHAGFLPEDARSTVESRRSAGPDAPHGTERARIIGRLREIADIFAAHGLRIGFETGQETAETLARVLAELDRGNVGVNFDPANMILYGKGDPAAALERLAPHVVQIHVKDAIPSATPGTWGREVPAGEGAVDWDRFFAIARAIDPPVDFVIEREAGKIRADDIVAARRLIERHLAGDGAGRR
jgi:sugar phosphate isomerase/epimerase